MSAKKAINLFTIGFTQKSAEQFFDTLMKAGVRRVIDTRLNNVSQLAGFAKRKDLEYFLRTIGNIEYVHLLDLAPTQDILDVYKQKFLELMGDRQIEHKVSSDILDGGCLLCSEPKPHNCHRRLVAEYLSDKWKNVTINHLSFL